MASIYKFFGENDSTETKTVLHEYIPITGTIVSGTYGDNNIVDYSHQMYQSVYDYPYASSSANHIFDITFGLSANSVYTSSLTNSKYQQVYYSLAQVLAGYDENSVVRRLDVDGNYSSSAGKMNEVFFINFARLLYKDEIKKGSCRFAFYTGGTPDAVSNQLLLTDAAATESYFINSPAGEYGVLYDSANTGSSYGLVFYQAGIAAISASLFDGQFGVSGSGFSTASAAHPLVSGTIVDMADGLRNRMHYLNFNNSTELNSKIYFCRAHHHEFNYSSNPTYLTGSKIRVKEVSTDEPVAYITTIGLYSADNELMAVAKVSEPFKKTPSNELTMRVRLDF